MFLEKLEIQGFKSFATKNQLIFPGLLGKDRWGITSIVGPNGSGKSNIADAIRWVLGEQSMKTLRGKKSEDVIFSGSDKKGKLGMAEVSLFLNNEDKKAPIDYSELVITRRLFRDGESEYLINNSKARLADIQMLLAKANVGQKTYSVIGQGMVEGFLNTSLAERKEFFDEATGVKQYQIKRDASLNKLKNSYENLDQVSMLLNEIEPRLKSLTRQVSKLHRRGELEEELKKIRLGYYAYLWHDIKNKFSSYNNDYLELEKIKSDKDKKMEQWNRDLNKIELARNRNEEYENWQKQVASWQMNKDKIIKQLARLDAQSEIKLEAEGQFDLSWLNNKKTELENEASKINSDLKIVEQELRQIKNNINEERNTKNSLDKKLEELNRKLLQLNSLYQQGELKIDEELKKTLLKLESLIKNNNLEEIKKYLKNIYEEIKDILKKLIGEKKVGSQAEINEVNSAIFNLNQEQQKILAEINKLAIEESLRQERIKLIREKQNILNNDLFGIENKLKQYRDRPDQESLKRQKNELEKELEKIKEQIENYQTKITAINKEEEEERAKIFELQKNVQSLQNEINEVNHKLGELKINSTRYETKLEDLEIEIRRNLGSLKEVKEATVNQGLDLTVSQKTIADLSRQLEQIGGIDPETEKEYEETKTRFDFLTNQVNDLQTAINSLEEIIKELDGVIKEKFDQEFKQIQSKFEEYFKILFSGGKARVIKVMEEEEKGDQDKESPNAKEGEKQNVGLSPQKIKFLQKHNATGLAGIEIEATPPGKKIQSISMLSGGERALTAIALICAIISANPSPFVVLDEVDAALDEANSERLAKILDDLSHRTQFIVITHNRASMRRASVLYGVTMQDSGVSKLLSIKLEDIKE